MSRILLIAPSVEQKISTDNFSAPHLGLHRIAFHLRKKNHTVEVWDFEMPENLEYHFKNNSYDIIGLSFLDSTLGKNISLSRELKRLNPNSWLVAGGCEAVSNYQEIIEKAKVDAVILGEGERQMALLAGGHPLHLLDGVIIKRPAKMVSDTDLFEFYNSMDFSKIGYKKFWSQTASYYSEGERNYDEINTVRLITSTHCPKICAYCSVSTVHEIACGKRVKPSMMSAYDIYRLLCKIKRELPETRTIYKCEDDFCLNSERVYEFCDLAGGMFRYLIQTSSNSLDEKMIKKLAEANIKHITVGVENCSERVLQTINKPQSIEKIDTLFRVMLDNGINPYCLIILFLPEITVDELKLNIGQLTEWQEMGVTVSIEPFCRPYKNAPLWNSLYEFEYSLQDGLKHADYILPKDRNVRDIMFEFRRQLPKKLDEEKKKISHAHRFKGITGKIMIELLGEILKNGCKNQNYGYNKLEGISSNAC